LQFAGWIRLLWREGGEAPKINYTRFRRKGLSS